jgi:hypothetical protein
MLQPAGRNSLAQSASPGKKREIPDPERAEPRAARVLSSIVPEIHQPPRFLENLHEHLPCQLPRIRILVRGMIRS